VLASHGTHICPPGESGTLRIKSRQALIHAYFQVYPWTVVSHSVHSTLTRLQLHLTALKLHCIRTSQNPHPLALALTLLRTNRSPCCKERIFNEGDLFGWQLIPCKALSELWILWSFNSGSANAFWNPSAILIHILPSCSGEQPVICAHKNGMLQL
jgi:hypothetical protein